MLRLVEPAGLQTSPIVVANAFGPVLFYAIREGVRPISDLLSQDGTVYASARWIITFLWAFKAASLVSGRYQMGVRLPYIEVKIVFTVDPADNRSSDANP